MGFICSHMLSAQNYSIFSHSSLLPNRFFYFYFVVLYIWTARGNQPTRDLNIWTKFHGSEEHARARQYYALLCTLVYNLAGAMPRLGQIPPGAMGSRCLSHICSGLPKHAKAPAKAILERCSPALSPLENCSLTCDAFPTGSPRTREPSGVAEWVWTFNRSWMYEMVMHYGK